MKKIRLTTHQMVAIGVVLFVIAVLALLVLPLSGLVAVLLLETVGIVALFIFQKQSYELSETESVALLQESVNDGLLALLDQIPVGVVKADPETGTIEWFNPFVSLVLSNDDGELDQEELAEIIRVGKDQDLFHVDHGNKRYAVHQDVYQGMYYFFDVTNEYQATQRLMATRPVIGVLSVDNYDELEDMLPDSQISQINSFLAQFVANFADEHQMYYRRGAMDRFYLFTDYEVLETLIDQKFSIIDQFREEAKKRELPLTLSFGVAYGDDNYRHIGQVAFQNLNMAEVRGGDQVVVKETADSKQPIFFGGGTVSATKRTRTRTRAMMTALSDRLKTIDRVFVVGHRQMDMDALGAAIGMQHFAQNAMSNAYTVYNDKEMLPDIARAIERLKEEHCSNLITISEAMKKVTEQSLLIMVDHSKISLTLSKELYDKFSQVIVVDHHRRDADFPDKAVLTYIESGASSASELVTELIQFQNDKHHKLNRLQASLLMAGIMLDTKNFASNVTSRTFDVASYLRARGSDTLEINRIGAVDFEEYRKINELVLRGKALSEGVILVTGPEDQAYDSIVTGKAADTVLGMAGIEAAFVVTRHPNGYIAISARSKQTINVQRIMEEMGGGGHFSIAAAQCYDQTMEEVTERLTQAIETELTKA